MEFPPPQRLTLPDGRNISYAIFGDTTTTTTTTSSSSSLSKTIFYHHGFPSSRNEAFYLSSAASAHGIRLISIDRPGHGFSSAQPGRMILDSAADVEMLAAHLGIKSYAVLGVSGGAPYALACAWRNMSSSGSSNDGRDRVGSRCIGIATVSGLYPASLGLKGILPITRLAFFVAAYLSQGLVSRAMRWAVGSADFETSRKRFGNTIKSSRPREDWDAWMKYPDFQSALAAGVVGAFEGEGLGGGVSSLFLSFPFLFSLPLPLPLSLPLS